MKKNILIAFFLLFLFSSCSKRLYYLHDEIADKNMSDSTYIEHDIDYRITEFDILRVNIKSANPEISNYFNSYAGGGSQNDLNQNQLNQTNSNSNSQFYFTGYSVNDSGYIKLPIIGDVLVADKTLPEATKYIQELADEYLDDAFITVQFVSFKVTFLGEFDQPGTIVFFQDKLNVYEAIERAGGITDYGNRSKVLVVRQTAEGRKTFYINLQDRNILASEDFFLLPNDMVYVKPLKWRSYRVQSQDFIYVLTSITSIITTTLLILNLNKN